MVPKTIESSESPERERGSGQGSSQLIEKVVALIEHISEHGPSTAAGISKAIDEPRSSVYRLLGYLANVGWIVQSRKAGAWELSVRLFRLGSEAVNRLDFTRVVRPFLEELHDVTGNTVFLCVAGDSEAVCIDRIDGRHVTSLELKLGGSLPFHLGAASFALLAFGSKQFRARWEEQARGSDSRARRSELDVSEILARIQRVREDGYAVSDEDVTAGIASIGAPIFDYTGNVVAAISMGGLSAQILDETARSAEQVVSTARRASEALGYLS